MKGSGDGLGITDILFSLRASVGLIVRAAKPVACALLGRIDCLFTEDGVMVRCRCGLPGEREPGREDRVFSGVLKELPNGSCPESEGMCNDLVLFRRAAEAAAKLPPGSRGVGMLLSACKKDKFRESSRWSRPGRSLDSKEPARSCVNTPGPTDFRGLLRTLIFALGGGSCLLRGLLEMLILFG